MKKRLVAVLLMLSVFTTGAFAANAYRKTITVDYGIKLQINGSTPTLTDANGNTVQPFTYNGTTYVPIRAVANEMCAYVGYDSASGTAIVYQDDVEAIVFAHHISENSSVFYSMIDNFFYLCHNYESGLQSYNDASASIMRYANIIDGAYEEIYNEYSTLEQNENIYIEDIDICVERFVEEYNAAVRVVGYAASFINSKNPDLLLSILNEPDALISAGAAYGLADDFIDSMWEF